MRLGTLAVLLLPLLASNAYARSFSAQGADAGAGLGARAIAMGGTGVAAAEGVNSIYYNPANLAGIEQAELAYDLELGATLPVSYVGVATPVDWFSSLGLNAGVGFAFYPRVYAEARGAFSDSDFESIFLRYLLPGLDGTFDGELISKTKVYRAALGVSSAESGRWGLGFNIDYIDCRSDFCGTTASSPTFTAQSAGAKAIGMGLSGYLQASPRLKLGASVSDLGVELSTDVTISDASGNRTEHYDVKFPIRYMLGAEYQFSEGLLLVSDFERMVGTYGDSRLDIQIVRAGAEYILNDRWAARGGFMAPVKMQSEASGDLDLPFPLAPTFGVGYQFDGWNFDAALYPHPLNSAHTNSPEATLNLGVTYRFL